MPQRVGTIKELWRYPVKSMVGETVDNTKIESFGMVGDRTWAVRDETAQEITVVRKNPKLLMCGAAYIDNIQDDIVLPVTITFPDGRQLNSSDADIHQSLSDLLGKPVSLWPLQPKSNWRHYRLNGTVGAKEIKRLFASEEIPDLSSVSWKLLVELMFFATPLGRYYDAYPLHILTTGALRKMAEIDPTADFGAHRFRPNIVIDTEATGFEEFSWVGGMLHIGDVVIKCESRTVRCLMPSQAQLNKSKDSNVLKAVSKHVDRHFGINASVVKRGSIKTGDEVLWAPYKQTKIGGLIDKASAYGKNTVVRGLLNAADFIAKA